MVSAIGAAVAGVAVLGFLKGAISEAQDAAKVGKLTEAVIRSTGAAAKVTAAQMSDLAGSLSDLSGVDDEVIQSGENVLATFTSIRNEVGKGNNIFDQATEAALNMSAALGTDLQASAIQVGKALNDPIKGVTALSKVGVSFTDQQREQIKAMVEAGDVMGAQKVILAELSKEFAGAAEAAKTPAMEAQVAWGNFQEMIGEKLLPVLADVLHFGLANQQWLVPLVGTIAAAVVATKALTVAQDSLGLKLNVTAASAGRLVGALGLAIEAANLLDTAWQSSDVLVEWNDKIAKIIASTGLMDEETARSSSTFAKVWGTGGVLDNLVSDGAPAEASLHRITKGTRELAAATHDAGDEGETLLDVWNRLHGVMADSDKATLNARRAIEDLKDTFKEGGKAIDGMSLASLENRVALEDTAKTAVEAAIAFQENGHSAAETAVFVARLKDEAIKNTGATGKQKDAVKALVDELFKIPANVNSTVNVTANLSVVLRSSIASVQKKLNSLALAEGGILKFFAGGGMENHVAQIVRAGTLRVWGEEETGGEAYIPLGGSKRARSTAILAQVAGRFGYDLVANREAGPAPFAAGAGGSANADMTRVVGLLERLIDAVERVAPGVGRHLGGAVSASFQLSRAR
jgi:hypothetical protein